MKSKQTGVVLIGRNEGERLRRCLDSVASQTDLIVYVDSGSTDDSVALAESFGGLVVNLDTSIPFTAARARNEGFEALLASDPTVEFVQFVDGDCELLDGWIEAGENELRADDALAVVCGWRTERFREATVYNMLCDIEWRGPPGYIDSCGGDALMRVSALRDVGGYRASMIAGEEPELCVRLRRAEWKILRLPMEMTIHDAAMTRFAQWWKRATRCGHSYAELAWLHGLRGERSYVRSAASIVFWAIFVPLMAFGLSYWTKGLSLLLLIGYCVPLARVQRSCVAEGNSSRDAWWYGASCTLCKFPEFIGLATFVVKQKILRQDGKIIEYKAPEKV